MEHCIYTALLRMIPVLEERLVNGDEADIAAIGDSVDLYV